MSCTPHDTSISNQPLSKLNVLQTVWRLVPKEVVCAVGLGNRSAAVHWIAWIVLKQCIVE